MSRHVRSHGHSPGVYGWVMRTVRFVLMAALAFGGVACGGDDDDGGGEALTHEQFVAQGNAICKARDDRVNAKAEATVKERSGIEPTATDISKFLTASIPEVRRMFDELSELDPPEADRQAFADLVDQGRDALNKLEEIKDGPDVLERLREDVFATFNRGASRLGLTACDPEGEGGGH